MRNFWGPHSAGAVNRRSRSHVILKTGQKEGALSGKPNIDNTPFFCLNGTLRGFFQEAQFL